MDKLERLAQGEFDDESYRRHVFKKYMEYVDGQRKLLIRLRKLTKKRKERIAKKRMEIVNENQHLAQDLKESVI